VSKELHTDNRGFILEIEIKIKIKREGIVKQQATGSRRYQSDLRLYSYRVDSYSPLGHFISEPMD